MPGFDGSGPRGMGPRTGGGRGFCSPGYGPYYGAGTPYQTPPGGYGPARGAGQGGIPWGGGRGRAYGGGRRGWYPEGSAVPQGSPQDAGYGPAPEEELHFLKSREAFLRQELEQLSKRIEELQHVKRETP